MNFSHTPASLFNSLKVGDTVYEAVVWFEDMDCTIPENMQLIKYDIMDFPNEDKEPDLTSNVSYRYCVVVAEVKGSFGMQHTFQINNYKTKMLSENSFCELRHGVFRLFAVV